MGEQRSSSKRPVVIAILIGAVLVAVGLAVGLAIGLKDDDSSSSSSSSSSSNGGGTPSTSKYKSSTGTYEYAAVVADSAVCSQIGTDILGRKRGNAVDAAVASAFCTGLLNAHSAGIGGGSFIIIYDSEKKEWYAVDSRETAAGASHRDMFAGEGMLEKSLKGGLASGVPGEVMGLWEVHRRLGKLPWADVVRPSTKLCQSGVPLTTAVRTAVTMYLTNRSDYSYYFDDNNNVKPVGSLIKMPLLAQTFQIIESDPASFYNGSLAEKIVEDLKDEGGIITLEDLKSYRPKWSTPTKLALPGGYTVYSIPAPGSGPVLSYILNILAGYNMSPSSIADEESKILTYHRIIEAFKFAYGKRTDMGDEDFVDIQELVKNMTMPSFGEATRSLIDDAKTEKAAYYHPSGALQEDHGTTQISILDGQGNAVSITGTINTYFGSKVKGSRTGIVFNNEMNDFSVPNTTNYFGLPASPANFIAPGKRPMSSMSPAIVWDSNTNKVRMVTGASGGSKITSSTAMNIIDVLWLGLSLPEAIDHPRMHHQLIPEYVQVEEAFPKDLEDGLKAKGHEFSKQTGFSVVQAIDVTAEGIVGTADFRKGGEPRGL